MKWRVSLVALTLTQKELVDIQKASDQFSHNGQRHNAVSETIKNMTDERIERSDVVPIVIRRCDKDCRFYGYEYDGQLDHICRVKPKEPMIITEVTYAKDCPDFKKRNGV